jgi:hypothetical protein
MEWLVIPFMFLAVGVWIHGWPSFVTINHYHGDEEE